MIEDQITIGLALECRDLGGKWGGIAWRPIAVFADVPEVEPWTSLGGSPSTRRYFAGAHQIALYSTDTANYRDNLATGQPKLWVVMRPDAHSPPVEIVTVTADPAEGEASTEAGSNVVEAIEMPAAVAAVVAAFIAAHHVERPMYKRQRGDKRGRRPDGDGGAT